MSPTVTKFPKLPKLILFVKKHVFNMQIRKNRKKNRFIKLKSTRHLQALLLASVVLQI
jgi:hypothetical protein